MAGRLLAAVILSLSLLAAAAVRAESLLPAQQPRWSQLNAQQRTALAPLAREWNALPDSRKQKWLGIARRFATLSDIEQARMQDRMREWLRLTPAQRDLARIQYKQLQAGSAEQRRALERKWQEYSALPEAEKARLRAAGRPVASPTPPNPLPAASAPASGQPGQARAPKALTLKVKPTRGPAPVVSSAPAAEEPEYPDDSDY